MIAKLSPPTQYALCAVLYVLVVTTSARGGEAKNFAGGTSLFFKNELFLNLKANNERNKIALIHHFSNSNNPFLFVLIRILAT